jgi:hypothetical protein
VDNEGKQPLGGQKGNLNSLKNGRQSRQMRRALYSDSTEDWSRFLARLKDDSQRGCVILTGGRFPKVDCQRVRGAPAGNLNRLKNGQYSRQMRQALGSDSPDDWQNFLARLGNDRQRACVTLVAVMWWINKRRFARRRATGILR